MPLTAGPKNARSVLYHAWTLWLFTVNDLKTMVFPSTAFAIFTGLPTLRHERQSGALSSLSLEVRVLMTLTWTWFNLLAFAVANQKSPASIEEDKLNKPWRPMPSGRLSAKEAARLSTLAYLSAVLVSDVVGGGMLPCLLLWGFGHVYNNAGGGDRHWLVRNMLNACGFTSFAAGALEVLLQRAPLDRAAVAWLFAIGLVVCSTVHAQDMYDQEGDAAAGRRTIPLIIGDGPARYTIVLPVLFWSCLCPWVWRASSAGYVLTAALGSLVATRSLLKRSVGEDRTTFKFYNAWLVSLYALPMLQVG